MFGPAIIADRLRYHYGQTKAVDGISFKVGEGEITGFLGPYGAGKTTPVNMLTGQLRPQDGHATLLGVDVAENPAKVKAQIGVSFESISFLKNIANIKAKKFNLPFFNVFDTFHVLRFTWVCDGNRLYLSAGANESRINSQLPA